MWTDWLSNSFFRIRVAPAAANKLERLPIDQQSRLRQMFQDITDLADLTPPNAGGNFMSGSAPPLLSLQIARVCVRYSISEESRTLTIQHVILLDDEEPVVETG
jgi:hypothetical protein